MGGTRGASIMPRDAVSRTANVGKPLRVDSALRISYKIYTAQQNEIFILFRRIFIALLREVNCNYEMNA